MKYERCVVCNAESFGFKFCSDKCEQEHDELCEEIDRDNHKMTLEEWNEKYGCDD